MKYANISTKEEFKAFMLDADAADMWDEMDPGEWKSACEYAGIDYNDYDDPDKLWLDLEKKLDEDNEKKIWYAVQENRSDGWDGDGSYNFDEAVKMLKKQGHGLIAEIDEEDQFCLEEYTYEELMNE